MIIRLPPSCSLFHRLAFTGFLLLPPTLSIAQQALPSIPGIATPDCAPPNRERPWLDASQSPGCRALEALAALNEEEKMYWGNLFGTTAEGDTAANTMESADEKLGLPVIGGGGDGPNGIADMSALFGTEPAPRSLGVTAFPNVITPGASWDVDLARRFGKALGGDGRGFFPGHPPERLGRCRLIRFPQRRRTSLIQAPASGRDSS